MESLAHKGVRMLNEEASIFEQLNVVGDLVTILDMNK
jgi:ABC-type lipopolysaccharide export system ATPase subunit